MNSKTATKEALLSTAIALFIEHGFEHVTINQICKEVEVTKTAFYYYFKSKDELISDYFSTANLISNDDLLSILSATDYAMQVLKIMEIYTRHTVRAGMQMTKEFYRVNLRDEIIPLAPEKSSLGSIIKTLIVHAQGAGQIKNTSPAEELHDSLCYLSNGVCLIWAMGNGNFDVLEESRNRFKNLLMIDSE
ncbi:TetR/AcrR family transcriptional regulator [Paenibacillaceae bacterium]|nr:TetR/AcrR family transcriptional regulator [Paenibacillaceae bacterium]